MNYIDMTPSWEDMIPLFITLIRDAETPEGLKHAEHELLKMARLADGPTHETFRTSHANRWLVQTVKNAMSWL